ncbi:MAG: UMP kinase [Pseudomonadota bacterium]
MKETKLEAVQKKPKRILLKLSGEALLDKKQFGMEVQKLKYIAEEIKSIYQQGIQIAVVIGGGNLFRGQTLADHGFNSVTSDQIGMLATMMNALALRDVFDSQDMKTEIMSAIPMLNLFLPCNYQLAIKMLEAKKIVIFAGGTGNPFFTTDSAASLRAGEINADLLIKATNVDGIYSSDPRTDNNAKLYHTLTYQEALDKQLGVMDLAAFCLCRDNNIKIRVYKSDRAGALKRIIEGGDEGTLVTN